MSSILPLSTGSNVPVPAAPTTPAPVAPEVEATVVPADQVEVGRTEPSLGYRLLRGTAGVVGGVVSGAGYGAVAGVKHAGDRDIELPRAVVSSSRIIGAAVGAAKAALVGATVAGPAGIALGLVIGPIVGSYAGGALAGGLEGAANAAKGVGKGVVEGFKKGSAWTRDLVDRMAAKVEGPAPGAPGPKPAPPAEVKPGEPRS